MSQPNPWMGMINGALIAVVGTIATSAISTTAAIAHGANVTTQPIRAYEIKAVYDSGAPMVGAQVSVFDEQNPQTAIETGITDDQGRWIWVADQPGNWTFQVRQAGHGGLAELEVLPQGEAADLVSQDGTIAGDGAGKSSQALAAHQTQGTAASALPRWIAIGSVVWGAIGTALFFSRRSSLPPSPPLPPSSPPLSRS